MYCWVRFPGSAKPNTVPLETSTVETAEYCTFISGRLHCLTQSKQNRYDFLKCRLLQTLFFFKTPVIFLVFRMQPRNFFGKQVYKLRLPPNYDSNDSCLSDSDNEYLPPLKRSLRPSDSSSDEESNGSDGQPSTRTLVENEVNANSEVSVKSGVLGPSIQTASRRII